MKKRNFKSVSSTLSELLNTYNLKEVYALDLLKKQWSKMGNPIATHTVPQHYDIEKKELILKVHNALWKNEFINNIAALIEKVSGTFKDIEIKRIKII